jgi:hypothetical protein
MGNVKHTNQMCKSMPYFQGFPLVYALSDDPLLSFTAKLHWAKSVTGKWTVPLLLYHYIDVNIKNIIFQTIWCHIPDHNLNLKSHCICILACHTLSRVWDEVLNTFESNQS